MAKLRHCLEHKLGPLSTYMNPWLCSLLQREELSRPGFRVRGPLAAQILVFAIQELVIGLCIKVLHLPGPRRVKEGLPLFFSWQLTQK